MKLVNNEEQYENNDVNNYKKKGINKLEEELNKKALNKINNIDTIPDSQLIYFKKFRKLKKLKYWCNICKLGLYTKKSYEKHIAGCNYIEDSKIKDNDGKKQNENDNKEKIEKNEKIEKIKIIKKTGKKLVYKNKTIEDKKKLCEIPGTSVNSQSTQHTDKSIQNKIVEPMTETPSNQVLYSMLQDLMVKYNKMENEFNSMKKYIQKTKKNINILDYLNEQCDNTNIIPYKDWIQTLFISRSELLYMFECKYISGIYNGLMKNLSLENTQTHCIKCFEQKKNIYFKYDVVSDEKTNSNNNDVYKWQIMDEKDFNILIIKISQQFMKEFQVWKIENKVKIEKNEEFYEVYMNYMKILLGGNNEKEKNNKDIKTRLYQYLKCDLKNLIHYDFTF